MSEKEKREIQGAALLEVEDAKADLALLRAKLQRWYLLQEKICHLLARGKRDGAHLESAAKEARADILKNLPAVTEVMNIDAVLSLDAEVEAAVERLKKAEAAKRDLGFAL